jgi:YHS domain-containing protein
MNSRRLLPFLSLLMLVFGGTAFAGDFFETNGAAIRGYDPVAYFTDGKPTVGSDKHSYTYKGSKFLFASKKNEKIFAQNPDKYAPQFGGFCAFGTANGVKVSTQPDAFALVDGKLYLNHDTKVHARWKDDVKGNIALAEKNWPEVAQSPQQD